ncbi:MAG: thioredoxin family protein [Nannocystaceae bacterium]
MSGPPELVPAPIEGAIAPIVVEALERARVDRRTLVVTVGARWCEPCVRFHDAVARGELDARLPGVRFLEFDLDRDGARLREAGYDSRYIPLFVIPEADGRGGTRRVEGGIKGDLAVDHILGRLGPLLAGAGA